MKSNKPSAIETISLLDEVVASTRSFADREKGLERARSIKDSNRRQSVEEQQELAKREHAEAVAQLKREEGEKIEALRELFSQRKVRVDKAQIEVRNAVVASIQDKEGQEKAILQRRYMDAGKARETALEEASSRFEAETAESALLSQDGVATEKEVIAAVKGFPSARSVLVAAIKDVVPEEKPELAGEGISALGEEVKIRLAEFKASPGNRIFNAFPLILQVFFLFLIAGSLPFLSGEFGGPAINYAVSLGVAVVFSVVLFVLQRKSRSAANAFAADLAAPLAKWKKLRLEFKESVAARFEGAQKAAEAAFAVAKAE